MAPFVIRSQAFSRNRRHDLRTHLFDRMRSDYDHPADKPTQLEICVPVSPQEFQRIFGLANSCHFRLSINQISDVRLRAQSHKKSYIQLQNPVPQREIGKLVVDVSVTDDEISACLCTRA